MCSCLSCACKVMLSACRFASSAASSSAFCALRLFFAVASAVASCPLASAHASVRARSAMPALLCTNWRTSSVSARTNSSSSVRVLWLCFCSSTRLLSSSSSVFICSSLCVRFSSRSPHAWPRCSDVAISWRSSCRSDWISRCILDGPGIPIGSLYAITTPDCLDSCNAGSDAELDIDSCTVALARRSVRSSRSFSYCETRESKVVWSRVGDDRIGGEEIDLVAGIDLGVVGIALRERHRDAGGSPRRVGARAQRRRRPRAPKSETVGAGWGVSSPT